jgi:hypothetical protein
LVALLASACVVEVGTTVAPGAPMVATVEVLLSSSPRFVAALPDHSLITEVDGRWSRLDPLDRSPTEIEDAVGAMLAAVWVPPGGLLISTTEGLFAYREGQLLPSPLAPLLGADRPRRMLAVNAITGTELWLASAEGLKLWSGGTLYRVEPEGLGVDDPLIAWGALWEGSPALWVASGTELYALRRDPSGGFHVWSEREDLAVDALVTDHEGNLWLCSGGTLHKRDGEGLWEEFRLSHPVRDLLVGGETLWIETDAGLWSRPASRFRPVNGGPVVELRAVDALGRLYAARAEDLVRVADGRPAAFRGLSENDAIESPVVVDLLPTLPDRVLDLEVHLDGEALELIDGGWSVEVDPIGLEVGPHDLSATLLYEDVEGSFESGLGFVVGSFDPPTWEADIEPLYQDRCDTCHDGSTAGEILDSRERWQIHIDEIIHQTGSGAMPLDGPPLDAKEVFMIRAWKAGGFLE